MWEKIVDERVLGAQQDELEHLTSHLLSRLCQNEPVWEFLRQLSMLAR